MKTKLLNLILTLFTFVTYSQVYVPDDNFEAYLESIGYSDGVPNNNYVSSSVSGMTSLDISYKIISDLTGIEEFTSLQSFNCSFTSFSTLMLPNGNNLLELICQGPNITNVDAISTHTALTKIDIKYGNVTSLNVDPLVNLEYLDCYDNPLGTLNLLNNPKLTYLNAYRCGLTNLDLSANTLLGYLNCIDNNLSSLNLTNNTSLVTLICNLCINMTSITLPDTDTLLYIEAINCDSLTALDVSKNEGLYSLKVQSSSLQSLDLTVNSNLGYLDCSNNDITSLTLPTTAPFLYDIYCNNNMIPSLNMGGCTGLIYMECQYNDLTDLDVSSSPNLEELYCNHNELMTSIAFNNPALRYLYCNNSPMLTSLTNTLSLTGLVDFGLWYCNLTDLDLTNSSILYYLEPGNNPNLTNLTLPNTTTLNQLWAYRTNLSMLDYTNNTGLEYLDLGITKFTSIDVSMLPNLVEFWGNLNPQLTSLNLKNMNNGILDYVRVEDNPALTCIQVDNIAQAQAKPDWTKDASASYNTTCALGIEDFDMSSISIYPNPSKDKFYIDLQSEANYTLSNVFGQEVKKGILISGNNELQTNTLSNGLYMLNIVSPEGKVTKKIIKD